MEERISVPEIHCDHCKTSIEGAVGDIEGVDRVEVDVDARSVLVAFHAAVTDLSEIVTAIEDQGYEVPRS